jgi:hypothetical protein
MVVRKSPTESATKFPVGEKKKGNDGNLWIVKKTKTGVKKWIKIELHNTKIYKYLHKKLHKWWRKNLVDNMIIIYKNGSDKILPIKKLSNKQFDNVIKETENKKEIIALLMGAPAITQIQGFINYLLYKISKKELEKNIRTKKYSKLFSG